MPTLLCNQIGRIRAQNVIYGDDIIITVEKGEEEERKNMLNDS